MNEASSMSQQTTSRDTRSATSSPALESGVTRSDEPDGLMIELFGPEAARASRSAQREKAPASTTSATCGLTSSASSASAALTSSLANRLRQRLRSSGSTLFRLTWKERTTPSGRLIPALRASAHRTSGSGSTGWQTPMAEFDARGNKRSPAFIKGRDLLNPTECVAMTGWPTTSARDHKGGYQGGRIRDGKVSLDTLDVAAQLASWPTPDCQNHRDGTVQRKAAYGAHAMSLHHMVQRASWPTPDCQNHRDGACQEQLQAGTVPVNALLGRQALLTDSGVTRLAPLHRRKSAAS